MTHTGATDSPIEAYLDELVLQLRTGFSPRRMRHLVAEAEAHLHDAADALVTAGIAQHEAERRAVAQFGSADAVATAERATERLPLQVLVRQVLASGMLLAGLAAAAVGASGVLAEVLRLVGGARFVVDTTPGQQLSAGDCARWLSLSPAAQDCHAAAVSDWIGEVVWYRAAVGIVGLLLLGAYLILRRTGRGPRAPGLLPAVVRDTAAVTASAAAAIWTTGMAIDMIAINSGRASGQWLSGAVIALAAACIFAARLIRTLRNSPRSAMQPA
jgi:hypothetical protein